MLAEIGILQYDYLVGYFFFLTAILIFIITIFMPLITRD